MMRRDTKITWFRKDGLDWTDAAIGTRVDPGVMRSISAIGPTTNSATAPPPELAAVPQAYLVMTGAEAAPLRVHYHLHDQFQLVVRGSGRLGAHDLDVGSLHYADAFKPYGPILTGTDGLSYLTLRAHSDIGIHYMPESRVELRRMLEESGVPPRTRRSITFDLFADATPRPNCWRDLISEPDALGASVAIVDPDGVTIPEVGGGGAFLVLLRGSLSGDEGPIPEGSLCWVSASKGQQTPSVCSADGFATIALLQFPNRRTPLR
jgi:hypothetical protein